MNCKFLVNELFYFFEHRSFIILDVAIIMRIKSDNIYHEKNVSGLEDKM